MVNSQMFEKAVNLGPYILLLFRPRVETDPRVSGFFGRFRGRRSDGSCGGRTGGRRRCRRKVGQPGTAVVAGERRLFVGLFDGLRKREREKVRKPL